MSVTERTPVPEVFLDDSEPPTEPPAAEDDDHDHGGPQCIVCGRHLGAEVDGDPCNHHNGACCQCAYDLPAALIASLSNVVDTYAVGLRDGSIIAYRLAEATGKFVQLARIQAATRGSAGALTPRPEVIDVRITDIVWARFVSEGDGG